MSTLTSTLQEISALFSHISDPQIPGFVSSVGYLQEEQGEFTLESA